MSQRRNLAAAIACLGLATCTHTASHDRSLASVLALGEETIPVDEEHDIETVGRIIAQGMQRYTHANRLKNDSSVATRAAHAKAHGCVRGTFEVATDLPPELQHGIFSEPGHVYPAWVRFSNGNFQQRHDFLPDARGLAIKLMEVDGPKLLNDEQHTQDFLLHDNRGFLVRSVKDVIPYMKLATTPGGKGLTSFFKDERTELDRGITPSEIARQLLKSAEIGSKVALSPLRLQYWNALPARLGPNLAVKMTAEPCNKNFAPLRLRDLPAVLADPKNTYFQVLRAQLKAYEVCFAIKVQKQLDPVTMPIEDSTVTWDETKSPFQEVARLRFRVQNIDSPAQITFCEGLSFSSWHTLDEHRPLGGLNRLRRAAYRMSSRVRHELNHTEPAEPTGAESFE